jgi:hypothetical protein
VWLTKSVLLPAGPRAGPVCRLVEAKAGYSPSGTLFRRLEGSPPFRRAPRLAEPQFALEDIQPIVNEGAEFALEPSFLEPHGVGMAGGRTEGAWLRQEYPYRRGNRLGGGCREEDAGRLRALGDNRL